MTERRIWKGWRYLKYLLGLDGAMERRLGEREKSPAPNNFVLPEPVNIPKVPRA